MILPFRHAPGAPKILPADVPILNQVIAEKEAEIAELQRDIILCPSNRNAIEKRISQIRVVIASCSRLAETPALELKDATNEIH